MMLAYSRALDTAMGLYAPIADPIMICKTCIVWDGVRSGSDIEMNQDCLAQRNR